MPRNPKTETSGEGPVEIPEVLKVPEPEAPAAPAAPVERSVFVHEFSRIRHHGVIGEAFVSECRIAGPLERKTLSEWDSLFLEWSRKPRG